MRRLISTLLAALVLSAGAATAQDKYPSRPIKVIVPYAPGGSTDIVARILGDEFQKITGQGFIVLNKPGAFGMPKAPPTSSVRTRNSSGLMFIAPAIWPRTDATPCVPVHKVNCLPPAL